MCTDFYQTENFTYSNNSHEIKRKRTKIGKCSFFIRKSQVVRDSRKHIHRIKATNKLV